MGKKRKGTSTGSKWTFKKVLVWGLIGLILGVLLIPLLPVTAVGVGETANLYQQVHGFFSDVNADFGTNIYLYIVLAAILVGANLLLYRIPAGKLGGKVKYQADLKGLAYFASVIFTVMIVAVPLLPVTAVGVGETANMYQNFHAFFSDIKTHLAGNLNLYFGSVGLIVFLYWFFFKKK